MIFLTILNIVLMIGSTAFSSWWLSYWLGQGNGVRSKLIYPTFYPAHTHTHTNTLYYMSWIDFVMCLCDFSWEDVLIPSLSLPHQTVFHF